MVPSVFPSFCHTSEFHHENSSRSLCDFILSCHPWRVRQCPRSRHFLVLSILISFFQLFHWRKAAYVASWLDCKICTSGINQLKTLGNRNFEWTLYLGCTITFLVAISYGSPCRDREVRCNNCILWFNHPYIYSDGLLIANILHFMKQNADVHEGISQA